MKYLYKVMNVTNYPEEHTTQLSFNDANELLGNLEEMFPDEQYSVWPDKHKEFKEVRSYNNNAVDGWEDLFNY